MYNLSKRQMVFLIIQIGSIFLIGIIHDSVSSKWLNVFFNVFVSNW